MAKRKQKTIKRKIARSVSRAVAEKSATVADCAHSELLRMLTYRRPYGGKTVDQFCAEFIDHLTGIEIDNFGNRILTVGDNPSILFSSHTDTVHFSDGRQKIIVDQFSGLVYKDDDQPLGADCATGIYIMLKMIDAKIPGLYIFHAGEEIGGLGSAWIVDNNPTLLDNIDRAVAFDRKLDCSVISEQSSGRCCSNVFASSLAIKLGGNFAVDNTGVFTDTANYIDLVAECTNLSVGYDCEHTAAEYQDLSFLDQFIPTLIALDWDSLPVERDPAATDYGTDFVGADPTFDNFDQAINFVEDNPEWAADLLFAAYKRGEADQLFTASSKQDAADILCNAYGDQSTRYPDPDFLAWGSDLDWDTGRDGLQDQDHSAAVSAAVKKWGSK